MRPQTVLVTGGAGYVGSHACKALARAGYLPVTYDSLEYGHQWAVKWGPLEVGRLDDRDRLRDVIARHRPSGVLHFAAYAYVGESVTAPARYYANNVAGTLSLLDAVGEAGITDFVFSSSCATYGIPQTPLIAEDHPQRPINPYGRSKLMVEWILEDYAGAYGLRYAALRYFNAAGADPDGEIGEVHVPETHLIPLAIQAALGGEPLRIFGTDYDTPDGTAIRDYVHVCDLAEAHVRALEQLAAGQSFCWNLGTGQGHSVKQVVAAVEAVSGRKVPHVLAERRPGDPPRLVAESSDAGLCRRTLEEAVASAWAWHAGGGASRR